MSKKNIFGKMTYSQRFNTSSNSELSEEDEGLALLIADIQVCARCFSFHRCFLVHIFTNHANTGYKIYI